MNNLFHLQEQLPLETLAIIETIQSWSKIHLEPRIIAQHWEEGTFPFEALESFKEQCPELLGYTLPKEYTITTPTTNTNKDNTTTNTDTFTYKYDLLTRCHITQTLASIDASFTTALLVQYGLCAESILLCGSRSQQQRFLPGLATFQMWGCFCLTEPSSGSDASNVQTYATLLPDGTGYSITGHKRWIGNATHAEVFVVWAKNTSLSGHPIMGFIVQKSCQPFAKCIQTTKIIGKTSLRMVQNANVIFDNAYCPMENVMPPMGFASSVGQVLESSRLKVAWIPVGMSMGALETTLEYLSNRHAFDQQSLTSFQLIQEKLVYMTAMISSMYLLAERMTIDYDNNNNKNNAITKKKKQMLPTISMVKAYNTKCGRYIMATCRELLGGNGIVLDYGIASKFCDMESIFTYEGTYDICTLVAGRALTGISAIKNTTTTTTSNRSAAKDPKQKDNKDRRHYPQQSKL